MKVRRSAFILATGFIMLFGVSDITAQTRWAVGDRCLANWSADEFWYPGTIIEVEGKSYHIHFDDEGREWLTADSLTVEDLRIGDVVQARWMVGTVYYRGKIADRIKDVIHIHYDDGDKEWTTIGVVRVVPEE